MAITKQQQIPPITQQQRITKLNYTEKLSYLIKISKIIGNNIGQKASAIVLGRKTKVKIHF